MTITTQRKLRWIPLLNYIPLFVFVFSFLPKSHLPSTHGCKTFLKMAGIAILLTLPCIVLSHLVGIAWLDSLASWGFAYVFPLLVCGMLIHEQEQHWASKNDTPTVASQNNATPTE